MASGEDRDQQFFEHVLLADDHLAHLGLEPGESILEPLDRGQILVLQGLAGNLFGHARLLEDRGSQS